MKTANTLSFALAALAVGLLAAPSMAGVVVLVGDGVSLAPIVVFEDATPFTLQAADDLAEYIEKITGSRPEVIEGRPDPIPEPAIWVGYQPLLNDLFPALDFDFQRPEEMLLAASESHLVIAGRDAWDPDNLVVEGRNWTIRGLQQEYGTANAVYTFIQDFLDVRWLWPGELGIDVVERDTIGFEPFEHRYHPQFRQRSTMMRLSELGDNRGVSHEWLRRQRMLLDSLDAATGGHAFTDWWEAYSEDHPEYFALQPDGTRGGGEEAWPSTRTVKMCVSNPDLWERWFEHNVEGALRRNPNQRVFVASPNDSWARGHCVCENCLAWDHPDGEVRQYGWRGVSQGHVALSDRHLTFLNKLAQMMRERYPDKDYLVRGSAYGHTRPGPVAVQAEPNVIIASVANFMLRPDLPDRGSPAGTLHKEQFRQWAESGVNLFWRPNTGNPSGWRHGLPAAPVSVEAEHIQFVAEHGGMGIAVDTVWEYWDTQAPLYYIMTQLVWNPRQDPEAVMADFYERGFGPAAEAVRAYWGVFEERFSSGEPSEVYTDEALEKAGAFLDEAEARLRGEREIYRERLAFVRMGYDYTRKLMENRALAQRFRESEGRDLEAARQARGNWERIFAMEERFPQAKRWSWLRRQIEADHGRFRNYNPGWEAGQ